MGFPHLLFVIFLLSFLQYPCHLAEASSLPSPSFGVIQSRRPSYHPSDPRIQKYKTPSQSRSVPVKRSSSTARVSKSSSKRIVSKPPQQQQQGPLHFLKIALAGGIAGAVGSSALYPMDAAKTLRQSSPSEYSSVFHALGKLARTKTATGEFTWHIPKVYRGVIPAAVGAIPSSALYFGAYESMKALLKRRFPLEGDGTPEEGVQLRKNTFSNRLLVHALAAVSGNVLSSAVFVPKELVKQQLQYRQSGNVLGVMVDILTTKGLPGMYLGYKATLMRNIPTAVLRFSLYEEFRYRWTDPEERDSNIVSPKFFLAGAAAGVLASGVMTPIDVLKTRLATGTCPVDVRSCFLWVIQQEGIAGLYSGAGSRMVFSGAFSAIGFGTFEWAKGVLGVAKPKPPVKAAVASKSKLSNTKLPTSSEAEKDGKKQNSSSKAKVLLAAMQ